MNISDDILRSPLVILTGAGASVPLGKLTTKQFIQHLLDNLAALYTQHKRAAEYLGRVLPAALAASLDVEDILGTLEDRVRFIDFLLADPEFARDVLFGDVTRATSYRARDLAARDIIYDKVIDHYGDVDANQAADLYRGLIGHLRDWTDQVVDRPILSLPFFTLNYDRAVEAACSVLGVPCVDGIQAVKGRTERRWTPSAFEEYRERSDSATTVLIKLHGSVRLGRRSMAAYGLGEDELVELPESIQRDPQPYKHAVLYPSRGAKEIDREPFYTHYRAFGGCLRRAALLLVVGCSLRDVEVRTALRTATEDNQALRILVLDPQAQHEDVARAVHTTPERVAVERREFTVEDPDTVERGTSPLMGLVRGYLSSALGREQVGTAYAFGKTAESARRPGTPLESQVSL